MAKRKAEWKLADHSEFKERILMRLRNGRWVEKVGGQMMDGSWTSSVDYVDDGVAALLLIESGYDLEGTGLEEFMVDEIETEE
jgi:hypothetical protein